MFLGGVKMSVKIYVDVGSNLYPQLLKEKGLDIKLLNMYLRIEDKEYICYDETIDFSSFSKQFYQDLESGKKIQTSLVNSGDYYEAFQEDVKNGNQIFCLTMAKGISGTYQAACVARDMVNEEQGKEIVYVFDTATAGFGEGLQAIKACELAKEGKSFREIIDFMEEFKWKVRSEFTVDTVKYLLKTGRCNAILARIVKLISLKIMLYGSYESKIEMSSKVLGRVKAVQRLGQQCIDFIDDKKSTVWISHCNCLDDANKLAEQIRKAGITNIEIHDYDLITGSHIGPKALAIFYVGKNRKFTKEANGK